MFRYHFDWSVVTSGKYFEWLISGLSVTIQLSLVSMVLAFLLGLAVAVMRMSPFRPLRWFAAGYLEFIRNTPLLVQIFFWYFGSYKVLPEALNTWLNQTNFEFTAAVTALAIYTSAFIAEDIRSGIRAIPKAQMEAAQSAGFSYLQSLRYILLPQAVRLTVPPLINQFLNLTKNSSLAMTIGVMELTYQARQIESFTFKGLEAFTAATLLYLMLSSIIAGLITLYNRKVLSPLKAQ